MLKKIILGLVLLIIIVLVAVYFSLNYWLKQGIETFGPKVIGVPLTVQSIDLKPWDGELIIDGLQVGNPKPFKGEYLAKVANIHVKVDMSTLFSHEIVVSHVVVDNPHVVYQTGFGGSNLGQLQANIAQQQGAKQKKSQTVQQANKPQKTVIINTLKINNTKVTGSAFGAKVKLLIPDIHMNNVGKKEGGMSFAQVSGLIMKALVSNLGQLGLSVVTGAVDTVGNVAKGAANVAVDTVGTVGKVADGAADAVGGAAKGVGNAIGSLFGGSSGSQDTQQQQ